jgi:hypothetical protein
MKQLPPGSPSVNKRAPLLHLHPRIIERRLSISALSKSANVGSPDNNSDPTIAEVMPCLPEFEVEAEAWMLAERGPRLRLIASEIWAFTELS